MTKLVALGVFHPAHLGADPVVSFNHSFDYFKASVLAPFRQDVMPSNPYLSKKLLFGWESTVTNPKMPPRGNLNAHFYLANSAGG